MTDEYWMALAFEEALKAQQKQEVPVGAIVVSAENRLLAASHNQMIVDNDPSAHAEILALRKAGEVVGNYRLVHTTLYVTLEPCPMCAYAMVHARIGKICFATRDTRTGAAGSCINLLTGSPFNHRVSIEEGVLQEECAHLLKQFFQKRRNNK